MKSLCSQCKLEYAVTTVGVEVIELAGDPPEPYRVTTGDEMTCPGCGHIIVANYAAQGRMWFLIKNPEQFVAKITAHGLLRYCRERKPRVTEAT